MIWACNKYPKGLRKKASPKDRGYCPICDKEVISKCGLIKIWHWSHKLNLDCDPFGEPETKWHYDWKQNFPEENQEVRIENHRADIRSSKGTIIELQNSPLSSEKIIEREDVYDDLIWILNGETIAKNIIFFKRRYKWKWFSGTWGYATKIIYIDIGGNNLIKLESVGSVGEFSEVSKSAFIIEHGGRPW